MTAMAEIGSVVSKVESWNPKQKAPDGNISYIDIASVDKEAKLICRVSTLLGKEAPSRARQIVQVGDVLVSTVRPNLNTVAFVSEEYDGATASTGYCVLRPEPRKCDGRFLFHWVKTNTFIGEMVKLAKGANYPAVSDRIVKGAKIPLPPLPKQRRIAATLDKADALRRKRQQAIRLSEESLRSIFLDMFGNPATNQKGWEVVDMGDILDLITYGLTVRPNYIEVGVPLISAKEIRDKSIDFQSARKISLGDFSKVTVKGKPKKGDILFSKTGAIGHCAAVIYDTEFAITQNVARLVFNPECVNSCYAIQYLRTNFIQNLANREAKGNAVKDLQIGVMKKFPFILPPKKQQEEFEQTIKNARGVLNQQELFSREADDLYRSLVQHAFQSVL